MNYKFGIKVEPTADNSPFKTEVHQADGQNYNPYGAPYLNDPANMVSAGGAKITSIPSPYARMHVTDIAFRELTAGTGRLTDQERMDRAISDDYQKAMSHCLDMFEIMYRFTELDLKDKGISVELIDLVTTDKTDMKEKIRTKPDLQKYIETLDLYRRAYNEVLSSRVAGGNNFTFDFSQLYIFKFKGITFGASSPFTGFFCKADCNLADSGLSIKNRKLLTGNKAEWLAMRDRDPRFLEFLYLLLKDSGLAKVYANLFDALCMYVNTTALENTTFEAQFPEFNFGAQNGLLPQIVTNKGNVYYRPNELDRSYLKYLLFLERPFDFEIPKAEVDQKDIAQRTSPDGTGLMPWLTVNDLLADSLIVLPYDIDDKFEAVYYEHDLIKYRRCLIPIKTDALNYLELKDLISNIKVKKYSNNHFSVVLTLTLAPRGTIELRRDYYTADQGEVCCYPNGLLINGADTKNFVFGVYPFVRSPRFENIYKVLFYNSFDSKSWALKFFHKDGKKVVEYKPANIRRNITSTVENGSAPINCSYFQVKGGDTKDSADQSAIYINFAELSINAQSPKVDAHGHHETIAATALIVPNLKERGLVDEQPTYVAVDLGTSNTYIAYKHPKAHSQVSEIEEISTVHYRVDKETQKIVHDFNELEFMHVQKTETDGLDKSLTIFSDDAILKESDRAGAPLNIECLSAQLCEFIPSRIVNDRRKEGFRFPIPTVVNTLRQLVDSKEAEKNGSISLLNRSIPFAYYMVGQREPNEKGFFDNIAEGEFKWFFGKNKQGTYQEDPDKRANFEAFLEELIFIVRCNMLCNGYDLEKVHLLWTYPLSFQGRLVDKYTDAWRVNFAKLFHPEFLDAQGTGINSFDKDNVDLFVKRTNESLSPIYYALTRQSEVHHLTVLIDVGGGSSDIVGYRNNEPVFITSFGFAGNALYLDGQLNTRSSKNPQNNYMRHFVAGLNDKFNKKTNPMDRTRRIDMTDTQTSISSMMNYVFSQSSDSAVDIFTNEVPKFMLQLHNAALLYQVAQVTHKMSPEDAPMSVYLTGNGSKLFSLTEENLAFALKFFRSVLASLYWKDQNEIRTKIETVPNPKAATVHGSLIGNEDGSLQFNTKASENRVIAFGDEETIRFVDPFETGIPKEEIAGKEEKVYENVKKFIDVFYSSLGSKTPILSKKAMLQCLEDIKGDHRNAVSGDFLTDSLFFQYISLLMEEVSAEFAANKFV